MARTTKTAVASITKEALTFNVDYNDGTAVDPPAKARFSTQAQITQFLSAHGATNFKHLQSVLDVLPETLLHPVTVNLAAGLHRPRELGSGFNPSWFANRPVGSNGFLEIKGPLPSTWLPVEVGLSGLVIDSFSNVNDEPYVDFSASNPGILTGKDVEGMWLVLSTGQVAVICEHTNDRVYLGALISPAPVPGVSTATIAKPSAIMRNSLDDSTAASAVIFETRMIGAGSDPMVPAWCVLTNIVLESEGDNSYGIYAGYNYSTLYLTNILLDQKTRGVHSTYGGLGTESCWVYAGSCSFMGTASADCPVSVYRNGVFSCWGTHFRDFANGLLVDSASAFSFSGSTFNNVPMSVGWTPATIYVINTQVDCWGETNQVRRAEIRNIPAGVAGLYVDDSATLRRWGTSTKASPQFLWFRNCASPCVVLGNNVTLDLRPYSYFGYKNGGGNTDVGIAFVGSGAVLSLPAGTDVTGALGDIRMVDGDIWSYSNVKAIGPVDDPQGNVVRVE